MPFNYNYGLEGIKRRIRQSGERNCPLLFMLKFYSTLELIKDILWWHLSLYGQTIGYKKLLGRLMPDFGINQIIDWLIDIEC